MDEWTNERTNERNRTAKEGDHVSTQVEYQIAILRDNSCHIYNYAGKLM